MNTLYEGPVDPEPEQHHDSTGGHRSRPRRSLVTVATVGLVAGLVGGGVSAAAVVALSGTSPTSSATSGGGASSAAAPVAAGSPGTDVERVAKAVTPSVVLLQVQGRSGADEGSGVVLSANGLILTNNHVVAAAAGGGAIKVVLQDGTSYDGTIVGRDPVTDLAVVQAKGASGLTPAVTGDSATLSVGQPVIAIGAPLGLQGTVTSGIVSALDRPVTTSDGGQTSVTDAIQTDAAINPGNSGGPLVDAAGRVIGIDSAIASLGASTGAQSGSIGVGFAIPIDEAMRVAQEMEGGNPVSHAELGVTVSDSAAPAGARIGDVAAGSAADKAGLQHGDVVTRFDDQVIADATDLVAAIRTQAPSDSATLTYVRGGQTHTVTVTLGTDQTTT